MKKAKHLLWAIGFIFGCSSLQAHTETSTFPIADDSRCQHWVDSVFSKLNVDEKVGQLLIATVPAHNGKVAKTQVRELTAKYKIGGLLYSGGTAKEQALLTNTARKYAQVPVMVTYDGEWGWAMRLSDVPAYPDHTALGCIGDKELVEEYGREVVRRFDELGINAGLVSDAVTYTLPLIPTMYVRPFNFNGLPFKGIMFTRKGEENPPSQATGQTFLGENDMLLVHSNIKNALSGLMEAVRTGKLSQEELDAKCRKVLTYKYRLGLRKPQPKLQANKINERINTTDAKELAAKLRHSAVTVLNNYFNLLPLTPTAEDIAVLSIGNKETDAPFVEQLRKNAGISHFHLSWDADDTALQEVTKQLASYHRVVVSITGSFISYRTAAFLEGLNLKAPLVYAVFTPCRMLRPLAPAFTQSSAVVLAHSAEDDLQQYVADVLFAKKPANGRLSVNIGHVFAAGTGCVIEPGMEPGKFIPEDYGMKSYVLQGIDSIARKGLDAGAYPGCRVLVWKDGKPMYDKGFGVHSDKDSTEVRSTDLFDLSALTKTTATLLAVMKLYDGGKIKLNDKASDYLPFLRNGDKRAITIRQLLFHESGLPPHIRFYLETIDPHSVQGPYSQSWVDEWHRTQVSEHGYYCSDFKFKKGMMSDKSSATHTLHMADGLWLNKSFKNTILQKIAQCELEGNRYVYSDLSFVLLQQIVEAVTKQSMEQYLEREFYAPMDLQRTLFLPLDKFPKEEIIPTAANDFLRRQDLCGYVHDETAACMGGVAGNAGLFSTAEEVAKIYQMLLNGGEWNGKRFLSEATCRLFTTEKSAISRRGLGFDKPDKKSAKLSPCSISATESVYGHTGFTGTCVWVDPTYQTIYVFLSNRICPHVWDTKLIDMDICTDIQELIYKSIDIEAKATTGN